MIVPHTSAVRPQVSKAVPISRADSLRQLVSELAGHRRARARLVRAR
jgi:hypothetical protein